MTPRERLESARGHYEALLKSRDDAVAQSFCVLCTKRWPLVASLSEVFHTYPPDYRGQRVGVRQECQNHRRVLLKEILRQMADVPWLLARVEELEEAVEDLLANTSCSCRTPPCVRCHMAVDDARAALSGAEKGEG